MALKIRGFDQITAWIAAVVLGGGLFTVTLFLGKSSKANLDAKKEALAVEAESLLKNASGAQTISTSESVKEKHTDSRANTPAQLNPATDYGYQGANAPWRWSDINAAWQLCAKGKTQSPIDISGAKVDPKLKALKFNYRHGVTRFSFDHQTLRGTVETGSWLDLDGDRYDLKEVVFHTPAEHRINGLPYELEIQMIHEELSGKVAIIAVQMTSGKNNASLHRVLTALPRYNGENTQVERLNWQDFLPTKRTYWQYQGSLTVPPCTENIQWIAMTELTYGTNKQLDALANVQKNNARPVQERHGRAPSRSNR